MERPAPGTDPAEAGYLLAVDAVAAEVLGQLEAAGCRPILLKGPSVAAGLYDDPAERSYSDVDVLIDPETLAAAEQTLRDAGFRHWDVDPEPSGGRTWTGKDGPPPVDLHPELSGVGVPAAEGFAVFDRYRASLQLPGRRVDALRDPALTLTVCLHAAADGGGSQTVRADLAQIAGRLSAEEWDEIAALARELDAVQGLGMALTLMPGGAEVADRIGIAAAPDAKFLLSGSGAPPLAAGVERILRGEGSQGRLRSLLRRAVPSRVALRARFGFARRSSAGLALAYVVWPGWVLIRLPAALLSVARARRAARHSRGAG